MTLYGPPTIPFAVTLCEAAPSEIVAMFVVGFVLAPDDGAMNVTLPPFTGSP